MRRLLSILTTLGLVLGTIGMAAPTTFASFGVVNAKPDIELTVDHFGCALSTYQNDSSRYSLYESTIGNGQGTDRLYMCSSSPNFHNIVNVSADDCDGYLYHDEPDWGDCASSISVAVPAGQIFCLYNYDNYNDNGGIPFWIRGPVVQARVDLALAGDNASSGRFVAGYDEDDC